MQTAWSVKSAQLVCCFFRQAVKSKPTVQVATQAIAHMPSLLLFPLVPFLLEVALIFWWVYVAAYLYSSGMQQHLSALHHGTRCHFWKVACSCTYISL